MPCPAKMDFFSVFLAHCAKPAAFLTVFAISVLGDNLKQNLLQGNSLIFATTLESSIFHYEIPALPPKVMERVGDFRRLS